MSLRFRRLTYLIFILLFLVFAPLMILHTAGYRYNWQKSKVEEVGVLLIDVKPKDSRLYLNDAPLGKDRPLRLTNLLPNYYFIRAEKDGYFPWQKNLEIKSRLSTLLYDIALFKKNSPRLLIDGQIKTFRWSPKGKKLAYAADGAVWLKTKEEEAKLIFQPPALSAQTDYQLTWSNNEQFLLLEESSGPKNRFTVLDTVNPGKLIKVEEIAALNFSALNWSPRENYLLYGLSGNDFYEINLNQQKSKKIAEGIKSFAWLDGDLYLIRDAEKSSLILKQGLFSGWEEVADLPAGGYQLQAGRHDYLTAIEPNQNNLYLIDVKNTRQPLLLLKGREADWGRGEKNDYLIYYNSDEWWIFDPKTKKSQMMGRYSHDLRQVLPLPDAPYFVFLLNKTLYLTELDDRDQRNTYELFDGQEISDVWLDAQGENIYFLDKVGKQTGLYQLEIR